MSKPLDIRILNGQLLDGTGVAARSADVGVRGDRIAEIGDLSKAEAGANIDARGKYVCPGFIDAHSHSDTYLLIEPSAPSKTYQGITTEIVGNCGASAAPLLEQYRMPADWADKSYPRAWKTVAEYRLLLEEVKPGPNVVLLVGHNTLRAGVMGYENRQADSEELAAMRKELERGLDEGARGLSTGLIYAPGQFAAREELVALVRVVASRGGVYTSHMRSEGAQLLEAIAEIADIAAATGATAEVSHLKTSGQSNWDRLDAALERMRAARDRGVRIAADRYPYTASCTDLDVIFPPWASEGGRTAVMDRLQDAETRARLRKDILKRRGPDYWPTVTIGSTSRPEFRGRPLTEIAAAMRIEPVDAALRLIEEDEFRTTGIFFGMSEANMWRILAEPYVMLCTDASLRAPQGPLSEDHPHPRAYGSFPLFLKAALAGRTVAFPEAVRKMTSLPAGHFDLADRGVIARGKMADVVVLDPGISDTATYAQPHQLARGVDWLIVNGVVTLAQGRLTGRRGGRFL